MPKGFNKKAIEGFSKWMEATFKAGSDSSKAVAETKKLLEKGFPQVRKY